MRLGLLAVTGMIGASLTVATPGGTARACSCAELTFEQALADGDVAFVGRALERSLQGTPGEDPVRWTMAVDDVVKGDLATTIEVWSGEDDGDCGVQFEIGEPVGVIARRRGDRLLTGICGGQWLPSELLTPGTLAAPTSTDPPALIALGRTGDATLASYDAAGQLVAWGTGADLFNASVCPGGDRLAGQAFDGSVTAVVRYDVAALSPGEATALEGRPEDAWPQWGDNRGFACTSADGDVAFLLTGTGFEIGGEHNALVVVDGPTVISHAVGEAWDFTFDPTTSTGVLVAGELGTTVERIDLVDGARHPLAELPGGAGGRTVAVDEVTGRIAVLASSDPARARWDPPGVDRLSVLDRDGGIVADVPIAGGGGVGRTQWLPGDRLFVYWDLGPARVDVLRLDGAIESSFDPGDRVWGMPVALGERIYVPTEDGVVSFALDGTDRREHVPGIARVNALAVVPGTASPPASPTTAPETAPASTAPGSASATSTAVSLPAADVTAPMGSDPVRASGVDDGADVGAIAAIGSAIAVVAIGVGVIGRRVARRRAVADGTGRPPATMSG